MCRVFSVLGALEYPAEQVILPLLNKIRLKYRHGGGKGVLTPLFLAKN